MGMNNQRNHLSFNRDPNNKVGNFSVIEQQSMEDDIDEKFHSKINKNRNIIINGE